MLTKQQMLHALDDLIAANEELHQQFIGDLLTWQGDFAAWLKACESTLEAIYGSTSEALRSFKSIYFQPPPGQVDADPIEQQKADLVWFDSGLRYAHTTLVGYRYSLSRLLPDDAPRQSPYVFISHGGPTRTHVDFVRDLLGVVGLSPVIVADLPNLNLSINEKVMFYMQLCAGAIILATEEDETTAAECRTRPNVENEVGMLQLAANVGARIVYLKEPNVQFASNYREKVWIPFVKERTQDATVPLLRELKAFGFLA